MLELFTLLALSLLASAAPSRRQTPPLSTTTATCPTDLSSNNFAYPHLIIPTYSLAPTTAYGNSYTAYISSATTTLFNFDISPTWSGLTCSLIFLFPYRTEFDPSAGQYYYSGIEQEVLSKGGLDFALLERTIGVAETWDSIPDVKTEYGMTQVFPGNAYEIARFTCPGGQAVSYKVSSVKGVELDWFQDSAPKAIGLYMVPCVG